MAWEMVRYICGHEERRHFSPRAPGREKHGARVTERPCPACSRLAEAQKAAQEAIRSGLPRLVGTEQQAGTALPIRRQKLMNLNLYLYRWESGIRRARTLGLLREQEPAVAVQRALLLRLIARIAAQPGACWWISMQDTTSKELLQWAKEQS